MRDIKFRQFDKCINQFLFFELVNAEIVITNDKVVSFDDDRTDSPIEQYTGLKDVSGNEIYEGDLVAKDSDNFVKTGIVSFIHGCWMVASEDKEKYFNLHWHLSQVKVIGNVHQNPELLEKNQCH